MSCLKLHFYLKKHLTPIVIDMMGMYTCIQCWVLVINGSNYWILHQTYQDNRIDSWPGAHELLFATTIASPVFQQTKMEQTQTAVLPLLGLIIMAYWWLMPDDWPDWLLLYSPQEKQVETDSQVRSGQVRSGQVRSGLVWSGQVRSGQSGQIILFHLGNH